MRMRNKKNLIPRMERCACVQILDPSGQKGRWAELLPGKTLVQAEMGCGKGRFTAETAQKNPNVLLVALEKVPNAMVTAMERVCQADIDNVRFIDTDVQHLADIFSPGEVSKIYINFPDPWPRTRQAKHRLTAPSFLSLYWDILPVGGCIEYKTDQAWLFDWSLEQFRLFGFQVQDIANNLHENGPAGIMTDYEVKFYEQGIPIHRCTAIKKQKEPALILQGEECRD